MATKKPEAESPATAEALVLVDCAYGKCAEVVTISADEAQAGVDAGVLDTNPDAVAAYR